ncbi:A/G-specific adenine glycosylase [Ichthyenterobacterium sp. W332]|uniref:Adenine DNA glycosylase n=1 Tax=Microcosmobacter mediterraneus TaxID=3075607 RepID=A0ABU2YJ19_9FLAO|nr:A/G-specific adenine glycosylase [Ichthyenterobacterium sp. W332]MDT0557790.1 A/G-specific adenine glycosylase [Ichthyenterobacterium sp. W332]
MDFNKILIRWFSDNKRDLPWRRTKNPYFVWLSEIILQQTQVKQGLTYYEAFVNQFPSVFDLANATENDVLKLWQGLGYYSRARNLHASAKHIAFNLNGAFPKNYNGLLELKGVGDYTASAIASICYNEPKAVVDGNVYRVLSRYFGVETPINSTKGIKEFKDLATTLIDHNQPGDYNQAVMEFGAIQCKPKNPNCIKCPLNTSCKALKDNIIPNLPVKLKTTKVKTKFFNYLVIKTNTQYTILEKRTKKGIWQNLYQFPLIESEQNIEELFIREHNTLKNIVGKENFDITKYNEKPYIHKLSHQHLHTTFWIIESNINYRDSIHIKNIRKYPTPILIANFIEEFFD